MMKTKTFLMLIFVFAMLCKDATALPIKGAVHPAVCGLRPLMDNPFGSFGSRVVGGSDAVPGAWPWIVSIQMPVDYEGLEYGHLCGGILINHWWVLTTAHCFKHVSESAHHDWRLLLGGHQLSNLQEGTQTRKISKKVSHPGYNRKTEANDITLLHMDRAVSFNDHIQPACLPHKDTNIHSMNECHIAGWGASDEDASVPMDILQDAKVQLIDMNKCNSTYWYNGQVGKYNLCAGYDTGGIDSCQGDSGGPLMCRKPQTRTYTVVGITSWGYGCGRATSPGVYTATQYYLDWIYTNMGTG